jgi:hypothetical protein
MQKQFLCFQKETKIIFKYRRLGQRDGQLLLFLD